MAQKPRPADLLPRFLALVEEAGLFAPGLRVLVGYSGGPDSTCLLHLLWRANADVVAAHLHHGQRPEADEELERCAAFCEELGVPFVSGRADVPRLARDRKLSLEEAGREARYAFFDGAAAQTGCRLIATAHTATDQAETVLLNMARGSGLRGLSGIPVRRGIVVRPLLAFEREETREYCRAFGLWTHDDPANEDLSLSRARIRARVLDELRAIHPGAIQAIARLAAAAREEDGFLDAAAAAVLERCEVPLNGDLRFLTQDSEVAFDRSLLAHSPKVLLRRAMRLAAEALGARLDSELVAQLEEGLVSKESGSLTATGGEVVFDWDADRLHVYRKEQAEPFPQDLAVPGATESPENGWRIVVCREKGFETPPRRAALDAAMDPAALSLPLLARPAADGDRMRPLGFHGRRKLADLLREAGLTRAARRKLPIVCDKIGPVWAPGVCLDERAAARDPKAPALRIRFEPIGLGNSQPAGTTAVFETYPNRERVTRLEAD